MTHVKIFWIPGRNTKYFKYYDILETYFRDSESAATSVADIDSR